MEDDSEEPVVDSEDGEDLPKPRKKAKAPAKKAKATKAVKPAARMRIVWQVVNDAFKTVGTFDFNQREAAEARAAELTARGKGTHFIQKVKEAMPDDAPGLGAVIPRPLETATPAAAKATKKGKAAAAVADDEAPEDDDFDDDDDDADDEEDDDDDE
jgi:hypothetical protein